MTYDAIVIGGGHNGLVCAFYLAKAGLNTCVLEARHIVGGAAVTEAFAPGFRNSTASYTVSLLQPKIIVDMALHDHGLRMVHRPAANFMPLPDGRHLIAHNDTAKTQAEFAKFSTKDADRLTAYGEALEKIADVLRAFALKAPPQPGGGVASLVAALSQGRTAAKLSREAQRDLLELFSKSAAEFLDGWFESDPVRALFGFDAVVGNHASPYTPGSAYVLLHHVFGEVNGRRGAWGHAIGGMGARGPCSAMPITAAPSPASICADRARIPAAASPARRGIMRRGRSCATGRCSRDLSASAAAPNRQTHDRHAAQALQFAHSPDRGIPTDQGQRGARLYLRSHRL